MIPLLLILAVMPRYAVTHCHGGETAKQVIHRTGAKEVIGGYYFGRVRRTDKRFAFDLVMIKGKVVVPYQGKKPVLVIGRTGEMRIEKPYKHRKNDYYAITGSFTPVDPSRRCPRQVVVLKSSHKLKFIRFVGTYRAGQIRFKGQKYLWMDGGRASNPNAKVPTHIIRKW